MNMTMIRRLSLTLDKIETMKIAIDVPNYDKYKGLQRSSVEGFDIDVEVDDGEVRIFANKAGLMTLASYLLTLSNDEVPVWNHHHLSSSDVLSDRSVDLILGKKSE